MNGEVNIAGVYMPGLLVLGIVALLVTALLTRVLGAIGAYRLIAYRPLVDLALFFIVLGALVLLFASDAPLP
ncbi:MULTISPECIES: DUF1656 domain-containing protein [unclassified Sphingomonas]|uniref:DUF1656 domain-containing protein n=1 Tax=unclassified Sphingomonas TaxID=196159 RepID=UPI00092C0C8C|nr:MULTISPECIES: DUF1656 domain-containing protein [unclassified Sphingomonas]MBN8848383.1 DUF1656 domain-containing protein [Sphingomonas sp.]MBS0283423.1 DUF1656 domain-containing protein [Pseudomonadota bacterium]OJV31146.1 MAG: DUF1656 domain-containing protein [Sphingomonas sp. 67-36]